MRAINPATGETVEDYEEMTPEQVNDAIIKADRAFRDWKRSEFRQRAALMTKAAGILRQNADEYGKLMALEMGKPIREGRAEAEKCAWVCEYYAQNAERFLQPEAIETDASASFVAFRPLGVLLAVMPWNFPFWQVFRFAAPALMAGNSALLKHASNVPGCAMAIEQILQGAGFPDGLFQTLLIGSGEVNQVIEHRLVRGVTLTGSTPAGMAVAEKAGGLLKKTVLELGGSDPYVILADADLEQAASLCVSSRLANTGQSCIAAKRFIVVQAVRERFEKLVVEQMKGKRVGDPLLEDTVVGPMARHDLRDELHHQVEQSVKAGAVCLLGGELPEGKGAFYYPTVLTRVRKGMPAYAQELFGPVASIISAEDEAEALRVANDTDFGLGAAVFTADLEKGQRIAADELEAGCCFVNSFVKSDPRLPFGGIKASGYGRELSHYGIKEFVNVKTVWIK